MEYLVRTARAGDLAALDRLFARSYPRLLKADYPPSVLVTAVPLIAKAQPALVTSGTFYVADCGDGQIVGAGGWTKASPFGAVASQVAHIRHFATDPDHVRKGIGRGLMDHVMARIASEHVREVHCYSTRTAVAFYTEIGFEVLAEISVDLRPGVALPAVHMRRLMA